MKGHIPDGLREYIECEVIPNAAAWDKTGSLPTGIMANLGARGWLGSFLDKKDGGLGLDMLSYGRLHEQLGHACSSFRSVITAHDMVVLAVKRWGNPDQKDRWLPGLLSGRVIAGFALSETGAGSDAGAIQSQATRKNGGCRLTGSKRWVTNGMCAGLFLVFARTSDGAAAFLVPRDTPGLMVSPMGSLLGVRAAGLAELQFQDCPLPSESLIGAAGAGLNFILPTCLALGRYSMACGCTGMAQACIAAAAVHARSRIQSGVPLSQHQLVLRKFARMAVGVRAAVLACVECGKSLQAGNPDAMIEAAIAKYSASRVAREVSADAVQIFGAEGCLEGNIAERFFRDAKVMEIVEGANEVLETLIGRHFVRGRDGDGTP